MDPNSIQVPQSPLGNFPELAQMYQSSFQTPIATGNIGQMTTNAQSDVENQKAALQAQAQAIKDAQDPSKYQVVPRPDGGYGFYDPTGKEISAAQYAQITGKNAPDVLKGSTNPIDIGFQKDFNDLQSYINNKLISSTNPQAAAKAKNVENQVAKTYNVDLSKFSVADLVHQFQLAYPTVYGGTNTGVPAGQVLIPPSQF